MRYYASNSSATSSNCVVYIHALGDSGLAFSQIMLNPLFRDLTFYSPDLPGYGETKPVVSSVSTKEPLTKHAEELYKWLRDKDILRENKKIILVGHSLGGVIGTEFCNLYLETDAIAGFINIEGNITSADTAFSKTIVDSVKEEESFGENERDSIYNDFLYKGYTKKDFSLLAYSKNLKSATPSTLFQDAKALIDKSKDTFLSKSLIEISRKIPVLFVAGNSKKGGLSEGSIKILKKQNIELKSIENAGHWAFLDSPEEFCAYFNDFLENNKLIPKK